jgi:purine-binding chemotaxis protein CheW
LSTVATKETEAVAVSSIRAGKFLSFYLGKEEFAIQVSSVREIIGLQDITPVPQTPVYIKGVLNLRGRVIPVIDLRKKCGLPEVEYGPQACIIVVRVETKAAGIPMGVVVDGVSEVVNIQPNDVENMPDFGGEPHTYLIGVAKLKGKVKVLLDIDQLLSNSEILSLKSLETK